MIIYYINQYNNVYKVYYHFKMNKIKGFQQFLMVLKMSLKSHWQSIIIQNQERVRYIGDKLKWEKNLSTPGAPTT